MRGIDRRKIFFDDADRDDFLDRLGGILVDSKTGCFAWAFMPNHITFYVRPTTEYVLSFFGQNRYRRRNYQEYVQKGAALGRRPELVGGGLVRSLGGLVGSIST